MSSDHPDSLELHEYRKAVLVGVLLLIMVAICAAAALIFPVWARRQVMRQADHGALSEAQAWLRWSSPFGFDSDETGIDASHLSSASQGRWICGKPSWNRCGQPARILVACSRNTRWG